MMLKKIAEGRWYSGPTGGARTYTFAVQDWGLQVKELIAALLVLVASGNNARVEVRFTEGVEPDPNTFSPPATIIATMAVTATGNADLPTTLKGVTSGANPLPYFRILLLVSGTGGAEEYVDGKLFLGGRPF